MEGNRVYLAACPDYGQAEAKLREAVAALGGMERFVRPGERILLKANLLRAAPPQQPPPGGCRWGSPAARPGAGWL